MFFASNIKAQIRSLPSVSPVAIVVAVPALRTKTNRVRTVTADHRTVMIIKNRKQNTGIMQHYETLCRLLYKLFSAVRCKQNNINIENRICKHHQHKSKHNWL